jgi:arabinan endo-1,5-alpha-L-arabinosidase
MRQGDTYYVYFTGSSVPMLKSRDLKTWERIGMAFPAVPEWVTNEVGARGLWAPDISFFNGKYHLFYAGSQFGRNTSVIGQATNTTLDPTAKDYKWEDQGLVFESFQGDPYNAIDPNIFVDDKNNPWLVFGSFWTGIKMRKLTPEGKVDPVDTKIYDLASRPTGDHSIEGPFLIHEGRYYYLFVSFDRCCRGVDSTYRVMIGRSENLTGPYVDEKGTPMMQGGGTEILAGDGKRVIGPGHCGLFNDSGHWLMVNHFYDGNDFGISKLQVRPVTWTNDGWPVVGEAINHEPPATATRP